MKTRQTLPAIPGQSVKGNKINTYAVLQLFSVVRYFMVLMLKKWYNLNGCADLRETRTCPIVMLRLSIFSGGKNEKNI